MTSRMNVTTVNTCVIPGEHAVPDMPWFPDWTTQAACRGKFSKDGPEPFFDYGSDKAKILNAKRVCWRCPVREECLRDNLNVPYGVFGGFTEDERSQLAGGPRRRPRGAAAANFFVLS
jgi:WhiB family redox-sensing transcriptional regulator